MAQRLQKELEWWVQSYADTLPRRTKARTGAEHCTWGQVVHREGCPREVVCSFSDCYSSPLGPWHFSREVGLDFEWEHPLSGKRWQKLRPLGAKAGTGKSFLHRRYKAVAFGVVGSPPRVGNKHSADQAYTHKGVNNAIRISKGKSIFTLLWVLENWLRVWMSDFILL